MFLPYDTTMSLWFSASPIYRWEPIPPGVTPVDVAMASAAPETSSNGDGLGASGTGTPSGLPAMRLVFRGVMWTAYPVFGMRENVAWQQVCDTRREEDEQRKSDREH